MRVVLGLVHATAGYAAHFGVGDEPPAAQIERGDLLGVQQADEVAGGDAEERGGVADGPRGAGRMRGGGPLNGCRNHDISSKAPGFRDMRLPLRQWNCQAGSGRNNSRVTYSRAESGNAAACTAMTGKEYGSGKKKTLDSGIIPPLSFAICPSLLSLPAAGGGQGPF